MRGNTMTFSDHLFEIEKSYRDACEQRDEWQTLWLRVQKHVSNKISEEVRDMAAKVAGSEDLEYQNAVRAIYHIAYDGMKHKWDDSSTSKLQQAFKSGSPTLIADVLSRIGKALKADHATVLAKHQELTQTK